MFQLYLRKKYFSPVAKGIALKSPTKDKFYNTLNNRTIGDKIYEYDLKVQEAFKTETVKDYHIGFCV